MRDLKEKYISFNNREHANLEEVSKKLDTLINMYASCSHKIFKNFATLLKRYHDPIVNSFTIVECCRKGKKKTARLSNGLMESLNRKPKDLKRAARGYRNFNHIRNRLLFASRTNAPILAKPLEKSEYQNKTGRKRGPYNKR